MTDLFWSQVTGIKIAVDSSVPAVEIWKRVKELQFSDLFRVSSTSDLEVGF